MDGPLGAVQSAEAQGGGPGARPALHVTPRTGDVGSLPVVSLVREGSGLGFGLGFISQDCNSLL